MGLCVSKPSVAGSHEHYAAHVAEQATPSEEGSGTPAQATSSYSATDPALQGLARRGKKVDLSRSGLPERVALKTKLLANSLSDAKDAGVRSSIVKYGERTLKMLAANKQPDEALLKLDIKNLPALASVYNRRYPGLNIQHFDSPIDFLQSLSEQTTSVVSLRAVLRLERDGEHHVAADVRRRPNGEASVIVLEPARLLTFVTGHTQLRRQALSQLGENAKFAFIQVGAQKSAADCLMFDLHFALHAHQHSSLFDQWHDNMVNHGTIDPYGQGAASPDALLEDAGVELMLGEQMLPAIFYKHTHSSGVVEEVDRSQPGSAYTDVSTSGRQQQHESLEQRVQAFRVDRGYSASIETSRATKIRSALETAISDRQS
ncbi:type III secretion system YopJ family effector XopJ [Xanthomonas campestris]|uniref:type III secretion system YopJ family effector XopJ n=1 Tax=Xanthomonas campestris TaxID=339 RepID=UPI0023683636|nr:type III secretion system YopJ family effector XopJ [Xanthomonas campestris]MEA9480540.1 type III secretion system YopJ family effector XopJ [Xanthomonas campestris]WDJ02894.1 type III secretion system YopJ family effector XopJ [Xanthomonas campestris]WDK30809.1 type III secretion system YopJ family effector XopJ [Xanthomonas campestris]